MSSLVNLQVLLEAEFLGADFAFEGQNVGMDCLRRGIRIKSRMNDSQE
jgi:hypothetical protein